MHLNEGVEVSCSELGHHEGLAEVVAVFVEVYVASVHVDHQTYDRAVVELAEW